jgi:SAM-dependent methyltransferase
MEDKVLEYWNYRASLENKAGSDDLLAKQLEIRAISNHILSGMSVAEFGCGNGETAIQLYKNTNIELDCFDYSPAMIESAKKNAELSGLVGNINFQVNDIRSELSFDKKYDRIYSERMIINLPDWESQLAAIKFISNQLSVGGRYLMCENSLQGLAEINKLRSSLGLEVIAPPWHNHYLDDDLVSGAVIDGVKLVAVESFSSTYYFLSRVVNAWLAHSAGVKPSYNSPVNELALKLPPIGDFSQGKLWIFEKL